MTAQDLQFLGTIALFALALAAGIGAAALWLMYSPSVRAMSSLKSTVALQHAKLAERLDQTQATIERTAPAKLAAEVDDLADALASHRRSTRAEFGRLWARVGKEPQEPAETLPAQPLTEDDRAAIRAALRKQHGLGIIAKRNGRADE